MRQQAVQWLLFRPVEESKMEERKKYGPGRPKKGEIRPPKPKAQGLYGKGKERPQRWLIGADAGSFKHSLYHPWQKARAQANFRSEEWELSFEDFFDLWKDDWHNRGRKPENMCMTRLDFELPWDRKNTVIITRHEHLKKQNAQRFGDKIFSEPKEKRPRGRPAGSKDTKPRAPHKKQEKKPEPPNLFTQYYKGFK